MGTINRFWFCDEHGRAGTDEETYRCCKNSYYMGWYETKKEQEERVEVDVVQVAVMD